jgi:dTDP-4-dehydrorhamnose 3,5-epimerase
MKLIDTSILGCFEIDSKILGDHRGTFVKTIFRPFFEENNLDSNFIEQYYSISSKGILRGLHFQYPPKDHTKLVCCPLGEILDVVVDLRVGSPTYGKYEIVLLNQNKGNSLYIPSGLAHGFYVLSDKAVVICQLTSSYSPAHDGGIRWDSLEIPWPNKNPILSEKDNGLPKFEDFTSPFALKN